MRITVYSATFPTGSAEEEEEMGETAKKVFSCGCIGCLGLAGAIVVAGTVLWHSTPPLEVTESRLDRAIPSPQVEAEPALALPAGEDQPDRSAPRTAGRIVLDLRDAGAKILAGRPGDPIKVSAQYDRDTCSLEEDFKPAGGDGEPWQYAVTFRREHHQSLMRALKEIFGDASPEVTITLPPDTPLALVAEIQRGGAKLGLDDLWLTEVDLDVNMGGVEVAATRPMRAPMERFKAKVAMGGSELSGLAWASPASIDLDFRMGGMELDLDGEWLRDADIHITGRMGGAEVRLPDNVRLEGVPERSLSLNDGNERPGPTLRFEVDCEQGEVEFHR